jgi:hydrogenase nickel incorporation protein HypB
LHDNPQLNDKKTIDVITKILDKNDHEAGHNRAHFESHGVICLNLMSSPGSGKTTLLEHLSDIADFKFGVVEGDLETNRDANRLKNKGIEAHQIQTGSACHLDAFMVHEGIHHMPLEELDIVFVENVGNLVCPASYDIGTHLNVVLLSVPEGDDKPAKYPVMFRSADILLITKVDLIDYFDFNIEKAIEETRKLNPKVDVILVSTKNEKGMDKWINYLKMKSSLRTI